MPTQVRQKTKTKKMLTNEWRIWNFREGDIKNEKKAMLHLRLILAHSVW